jgi:hypothetical protein
MNDGHVVVISLYCMGMLVFSMFSCSYGFPVSDLSKDDYKYIHVIICLFDHWLGFPHDRLAKLYVFYGHLAHLLAMLLLVYILSIY